MPQCVPSATPSWDEALRALLNLLQHAVKVVVTTRFTPRDLGLVHPERQARIDLDKGLKSPYPENILREMDVDGKVRLKAAPDELLDEARRRTLGNPRALEALFAILSADRDTTLREILDDVERLPGEVVEVLVGEAFSRLDTTAQMVMQALAIYGHPVTPAAVDHLLQPHLAGVDSAPVLSRLVNMQFARKEAGRYYLHELDLAYALSRVPEGEVADREATDTPRFTRFALWHRAARYFEQARTPRETWKTIEDLAPQLAEFDLRCAIGDYDAAASVLREIDGHYLLLWGHYRLMVELHECLQGRLSDPQLEQRSVGNLATAYWYMRRYQKATTCNERALEIAREHEDRGGEGAWLVNLGLCYSDLGQTDRAIKYFEQALIISREIGDQGGGGTELGNLGLCYFDLGQTDRAIEHYQQALDIAREIGDRRSEGIWLGKLGSCYRTLGQTDCAIEHLEQALEIVREVGDRSGEGIHLGNLGSCYSDLGQATRTKECCEQALHIAHRIVEDRAMESLNLVNLGVLLVKQGELGKAVQRYEIAIQFADEIGYVPEQNGARYGLARAHLYAGDLAAAHAAAEAARRYDYPPNNASLLALLGVIALRQGDRAAAKGAFETAVAQAEALLSHSEQNYVALDSKGLALCGLALCEGNRDHVPAAIDAYRAARAINKDVGIVEDVLRLFDELARSDPSGMLAEVRAAAARK